MIRQTTCLSAGEAATVHPLELAWDAADPLVLTLRFPLDEDDDLTIEWAVARDLAARGVTSWAGDGDVRIRIASLALPHLAVIELRDADTGKWGQFLIRREDLEEFIAATYEAVPAGTEAVDVDHALALLLAGGEG